MYFFTPVYFKMIICLGGKTLLQVFKVAYFLHSVFSQYIGLLFMWGFFCLNHISSFQTPWYKLTVDRMKNLMKYHEQYDENSLDEEEIYTLRSGCIYLIQCKKCDKKYVGNTQKHILNRINEHMHYFIKIQNKEQNTRLLYQHVSKHKRKNVRFSVLTKCKAGKNIRSLEQLYIDTLHTLKPNGLNMINAFR